MKSGAGFGKSLIRPLILRGIIERAAPAVKLVGFRPRQRTASQRPTPVDPADPADPVECARQGHPLTRSEPGVVFCPCEQEIDIADFVAPSLTMRRPP